MFGQIVAFLAVATSVAFASTCGYCYPGYGSYVNAGASSGVCGSRILTAGYVTPAVTPVNGIYAAPVIASATLPFRAALGGPEVVSSCENSVSAPVLDAGIVSSGSVYYRSGLGCGSVLGGCGNGVVATVC